MNNAEQPAFPEPFINDPNLALSTKPGLTKREYFAAICLGHAVDKWYNHSNEELVARSIIFADELLKQLEAKAVKLSSNNP